jgi:hypothetical protein
MVRSVTEFHPPLIFPHMILPHDSLFQERDIASALVGVSTLLPKVSNQKYLATWYRTASPVLHNLLRFLEAYPALAKRLDHLSPVQYPGVHKPFDLPHKLVIGHLPNAFLKTLLPRQDKNMYQYQFGLYSKLLLGLPIPILEYSSSACPCGM